MNTPDIPTAPIRIAHLSDIHFYESSSGNTNRYRHSPACLRQIEARLKSEDLDLLVVTGDITNTGDRTSLEHARQWIEDKTPVDGDYCGLEAKQRDIPFIVIPGNHDAWNAPKHGPLLWRWQKSVKNFNKVFFEQFSRTNDFVDYRWIEKGNTRVFVVYVDSCFLGDDKMEAWQGSLKLGSVARGKFARNQSEEIMRLYDKGIHGDLTDSQGGRIPAGDFLGSFKILAMHHYLFEPTSFKRSPLLRMKDKKAVFQNLAMCDFDVIICGHKHISDVYPLSYIEHFDPRAKVRLAHNVVRRALGLSSICLRHDEKHSPISRRLQLVLSVLTRSASRGKQPTEKEVAEIIDILRRSLENQAVLAKEILAYFNERIHLDSDTLNPIEIRRLHFHILECFNRGEQKCLSLAADSLGKLLTKLGSRPFAQIMPGSSGKASEHETRKRGYNIYSIINRPADTSYDFLITPYVWNKNERAEDGTLGDFSQYTSQCLKFGYSRTHANV